MAKVLILIGGHISTAPRPQKEADLFTELGHDVEVVGAWFDPETVSRDKDLMDRKEWIFTPAIDFRPKKSISRFITRISSRSAKELYRYTKLVSPELYGYGARAMLKYALKQSVDLTIVHSESGLWVGMQLLDRGYPVGIDMEDWFSHDLPPESRAFRPVKLLERCEKKLLQSCEYSLAPSHAMSAVLARVYGCKPPVVVYNSFPLSQWYTEPSSLCDKRNPELPSLYWFSHTIGLGRGLEMLMQALSHVEVPCEIHLRGNVSQSTKDLLLRIAPSGWHSRIFFHEYLPAEELERRMPEHDVGLALEPDSVFSSDLTASNKMFQYLNAGLAVLATDTAGQNEILGGCDRFAKCIPQGEVVQMAQAIDDFVSDRQTLGIVRKEARQYYEEQLCWELASERLRETIEALFPEVS